MIIIKTLLEYHGEDFELLETEEEYGRKTYLLSIEGYMGFEKFEHFIDEYKRFNEYLHTYINENCDEEDEDYGWKRLYKTRAIEVCYAHDCYWVFLDAYKSSDLREIGRYMDDVIKQLVEFGNALTSRNEIYAKIINEGYMPHTLNPNMFD
ncbi:hypothetical protein ACH6EH_07435 [Paenibacillus sp. JSM ZJ436]|uniref:hypothetical protein n=1 Tax=Paenibacillus sp. JSM ZJ436 TaxID=3376190 RepID=UPI00379B994C